MAKLNKHNTTQEIITKSVALNCQRNCLKLEMQNIVFPKWPELGLMGLIFRQCISTKEQPDGNIYDEAVYQTVLRIIGGKVLMSGRPDCYCWKFSKVSSAKDVKVVGTNSAEGIINLCIVLNGISDEADKKMLADMFASMKRDLLLVTTVSEERRCIEVTQELYDSGVTACVDQWMEVNENGEGESTQLQVGDYLIITDKGVYRIGHDEFVETHVIM